MATIKTPVEFKGEIRWAVVPPFSKAQTPFEPKAGQENNSHYSVEVECSQQQYNSLAKQGMSRMTVLREDEISKKTFIRLRSPKVNGTYTASDPVVKDSSGNPLTVMIANGSEGVVVADLETFTTKAGKTATALRFHTIMVTKLVPFTREENSPTAEAEAHSNDVGVLPTVDGVNW